MGEALHFAEAIGMTKREFVARRGPLWEKFRKLTRRFVGRHASRSVDDVRTFSQLFREVCFDLSLIKSRGWGDGLEQYVNQLVVNGHNAFYSAPPGNLSFLVDFLWYRFPRTFRANLGYFLLAAALFFLPLVVTTAVVIRYPEVGPMIVERSQLEQANEMYSKDSPLSKGEISEYGDQRTGMAGFYIYNNIGIAFRAFSTGVLFGVPTIIVLLFNGIAIGAVAGHIIERGNSEQFLQFVVGHGSFELTAIAVAGGAGLMLGDALLHSGQRRLVDALVVRGREAVVIALGAGAMLFVAALIEAYWSPLPIDASIKFSLGGLLWLLVFVYLAFAGREERPV